MTTKSDPFATAPPGLFQGPIIAIPSGWPAYSLLGGGRLGSYFAEVLAKARDGEVDLAICGRFDESGGD